MRTIDEVLASIKDKEPRFYYEVADYNLGGEAVLKKVIPCTLPRSEYGFLSRFTVNYDTSVKREYEKFFSDPNFPRHLKEEFCKFNPNIRKTISRSLEALGGVVLEIFLKEIRLVENNTKIVIGSGKEFTLGDFVIERGLFQHFVPIRPNFSNDTYENLDDELDI